MPRPFQPAGTSTGTPSVSLRVDDDGIVLRGAVGLETTYDLLLNGQHVWSLQPARDMAAVRTRFMAPWPKALLRYLEGRAEVALREHVSGTVIDTYDHTFGGARDRAVSVVDSAGHALVLDKWGRLTKPLSAEGGQLVDELMREVVKLLDVLRDECGVPAYIAYGTLLGAIRNGQLIGHDNDIDLGYVSEHPNPVDVAREGFAVQRVLQERGWVVRRGSGARLNVRLRLSDGSMRFVDVFTSHWVNGVFFIPSDVGAPLPREAMLPLSTVDLLGWQVPAPADPEALLAATYGQNWRTPDPSFKYETPDWLSRRLAGWFGGLMKSRKHWDAFNANAHKQVPPDPSPFARWVDEHFSSTRPMLDVGTGTARDALWFAGRGRRVLGIDYSNGAVSRAGRTSADNELPAEFETLNLYDTRAILALGARLSRAEESVDVYARFLIHALGDEGRANLFRLSSMALRREGHFFAEFRTAEDLGQPHVFGAHFRRYLDPDEVVAEIEATGGTVVRREEGRGLAPFREENPHVCRLVARWSRTG